jgi:HAD superfamily hydrolase (TIGR01459 family)
LGPSTNYVKKNVEKIVSPIIVQSVAELADAYDAFIVDQWGVLHDGVSPYPFAIPTLQALFKKGKRVLLLTNTAKSGEENALIVQEMGIDRSLFERVISAGDDARQAILTSTDPFYHQLGGRCLPLSRPIDRRLAEGPGVTLVDDVMQADWLFLLSSEPPDFSLDTWRPVLDAALKRDLPMVCGNPDFHRVCPDGRVVEAPGQVARYYQDAGGRVRIHGKPKKSIYDSALAHFGLPATKILAVGDSIPHDIAGAATCQIDSLLIASGVHKNDLALSQQTEVDPRVVESVCQSFGVMPKYVTRQFDWKPR